MREFEIRLENIKMFSHHGVFEHEQHDGNEFQVDLLVRYEAPEGKTLSDDQLENTISYEELWIIIREEMSVARNLLESVAASIAEKIKVTFPDTTLVECRITKLRPPLPGFTGSSSVAYKISD